MSHRHRVPIALLLALGLLAGSPSESSAQGEPADTTPTLGLEGGVLSFETPHFDVQLVRASQTVAALEPKGAEGFDFTPADRMAGRAANGFYHLGDLNLRLRQGASGEWTSYSTAARRRPPASGEAEAAHHCAARAQVPMLRATAIGGLPNMFANPRVRGGLPNVGK